ncbi:MAG: 50S ribosomal protein L23 [Albidovulum sp.]|nr:50S ribosomal protein L23 [Albidovulum sp.]MDE0304873.1 50S ribosomal protein L23 [Albidovulum sp.]MDE0530141.1 50S ribosomal protein L23 [Albidovulum sp.]
MTAKAKHYDIIRRPVVTEKSTMASSGNTIVFETAVDADKSSIKEAIESIFNVEVESVNTVRTKGKRVRFRGVQGRRIERKKAYVRLREGHMIDVSTGL